jgi:hypothetical protein
MSSAESGSHKATVRRRAALNRLARPVGEILSLVALTAHPPAWE